MTTDQMEAELEALYCAYKKKSAEAFSLVQRNKALESAATRLEAQWSEAVESVVAEHEEFLLGELKHINERLLGSHPPHT